MSEEKLYNLHFPLQLLIYRPTALDLYTMMNRENKPTIGAISRTKFPDSSMYRIIWFWAHYIIQTPSQHSESELTSDYRWLLTADCVIVHQDEVFSSRPRSSIIMIRDDNPATQRVDYRYRSKHPVQLPTFAVKDYVNNCRSFCVTIITSVLLQLIQRIRPQCNVEND